MSREKLEQKEDDEYDIYLFWPSRSKGDVSSEDPSSSPLYGPISLSSESEYDCSWRSGSRSPSPVTFAPVVGCTSPPPMEESIDLAAVLPGKSEAEVQASGGKAPAKYSTLFKLGLFFAQMTRRLGGAIDGFETKLRKPESRAR
ncbi:hypothetical protein BC827DRAFT_1181383 [Russula dissimulans]|nr:hypothetical protein BC827DRAFT_1181383 [Russula dissimulans]